MFVIWFVGGIGNHGFEIFDNKLDGKSKRLRYMVFVCEYFVPRSGGRINMHLCSFCGRVCTHLEVLLRCICVLLICFVRVRLWSCLFLQYACMHAPVWRVISPIALCALFCVITCTFQWFPFIWSKLPFIWILFKEAVSCESVCCNRKRTSVTMFMWRLCTFSEAIHLPELIYYEYHSNQSPS